MNTCPVVDVWGDYRLACILPAGHAGDHLASDLGAGRGGGGGLMYPHCKHCCWGNPHHPDDAAGHETPCTSGCPREAAPILFDLDTQETR